MSCEQRCYTRFPLHNITWSTTHMQSSTQSLQAQMGEWVRSLGTSSTQSPELDKELNHLSYHCSGNTRTQHMPERQMTEYDLCACRNRVLASQNTKLKYLKNFYHKRKLELGTAVLSKKKKKVNKKAVHTNTRTHTNIIIPTCTLPLSLICNIHNIYIYIYMIPLQVVVVLHAWWLCFSAGSCFKSACTALFNFFAAAASFLKEGGRTKAWLLLICAAAANKHHSTEGRRATTLNRTWRVYAQKENVHYVMCTSPHHWTVGDVYLKTTRQVHSIRSFL